MFHDIEDMLIGLDLRLLPFLPPLAPPLVSVTIELEDPLPTDLARDLLTAVSKFIIRIYNMCCVMYVYVSR
jgi:hypothetical protein